MEEPHPSRSKGSAVFPSSVGAARRRDRHTHRPGATDRHTLSSTQTLRLVHSWLRGFLSHCGLGPGSSETPVSPAHYPHLDWWAGVSPGNTALGVLGRCARGRGSINPAVVYHPWETQSPTENPSPDTSAKHLPAPRPPLLPHQ